MLPYFYPVFLLLMFVARVNVDEKRSAKKYGKDWERYCQRVKYSLIPYVY